MPLELQKQIPAKNILRSVDSWRRFLWPTWNLEKKIEIYANGGPPPGLDAEDFTCEEDMVPLGFAQQFMKRYLDPLLDPLYIDPGMIDAEYTFCKDPWRKKKIEASVNVELNKVVRERMMATITNAAGRATVTGRCYLYRRSPNDFVIRDGRMIHPPDCGTDPLDESFREWAFADRISLRDLEERLKSSKNNAYGWQKAGLERLKLWIMAAASEKNPNLNEKWGGFDPNTWLSFDIYGEISWEPVDVYWYFRKNGQRTTEDGDWRGHEKVDLYCISRFGQSASVKSEALKNGNRGTWLNITEEPTTAMDRRADELRQAGKEHEACMVDDNQRLLFWYKDRFDSIEECLVLHVDDARIAGEQTMAEVRGIGRQSMPKLAVEEGLLSAMLQGLTFQAQPQWSVNGGIGEQHRKMIERGSFRSFQPFPSTITPMAKNNAMAGMNQGFDMLRLLDASLAADANSAQPTLGGSQAEFAAQAQAVLAEMQQGTTRRLTKWLFTLDKVARLIGRTMCRATDEWKEAYPAYQDFQRMRYCLEEKHQVTSEEWDQKNWNYKARRLAGVMQRQQVMTVGPMLMQAVGSIFPSVVPFIAREMLRAVYGDVVTDQLLAPPDEEVMDQTAKAAKNLTISFITATPVAIEATDQAIVHAQASVSFANMKLQLLQAQGSQSPSDKAGMSAAIRYGVQHMNRLPAQLSMPMLEQVSMIAKAGDQIPVTQPVDPEAAKMQLAQQKLMLDAGKEQRLAKDGEAKVNNQMIGNFLKMRQAGELEKNYESQRQTQATQRAKTKIDSAKTLKELSEPAPTP